MVSWFRVCVVVVSKYKVCGVSGLLLNGWDINFYDLLGGTVMT